MSSTNKTTHYELSQFLGTDKPAWLNDYNADMGKIDAGINTAQTTATSADGKATTNTSSIGTLASLTTDAKSNLVSAINEVDSHANTAQTSAGNAYTLANTASTNVTNLANYFSMSNIVNYNNSNTYTVSGGFTIDTPNITVAQNSTHSLGKIYGTIWGNVSAQGNDKVITLNTNTGLAPSSDITIYNAGIALIDGSVCQPRPISIIIKTDGKIQFKFNVDTTGRIRFLLYPCLYFFTDFGDVPSPA